MVERKKKQQAEKAAARPAATVKKRSSGAKRRVAATAASTSVSQTGTARNRTSLPDSSNDRLIMKQRAALLAKRVEAVTATATEAEYIQFRLGESEIYGVDFRHIIEVTDRCEIVQMPGAPDFIAGVMNWRGKIMTILDLMSFFKTRSSEYDDRARLLILSAEGLTVGIRIHELIGRDTYNAAELSPPIASGGVTDLNMVKGIKDGYITILAVDNLLGDPNIHVGRDSVG
jgi:purine-binding chemotaxis protein CheW